MDGMVKFISLPDERFTGWEIEAEFRIVNDHPFVEKVPTGMAWGRCGCGTRIEGMNGVAIPVTEVEQRMRDHIREDHPAWPVDDSGWLGPADDE